jgi:hypothetical protein
VREVIKNKTQIIHDKEQMAQGINVQNKNKQQSVSVYNTVREIKIYTTRDTVHGVRESECTTCVQYSTVQYRAERRRTVAAGECDNQRNLPAKSKMSKVVWCERERTVKSKAIYPKKSHLPESGKMNFPMDQDPIGNEPRPGTSGMYIRINCWYSKCIQSKMHRFSWSVSLYKMSVQRSNWHKEYGE